jgi:DNA-binding helix-hairpin-helix protein with protein kinase domain
MPLERAIREFRFAYGVDAEARKMRQPPGALALEYMPSLFVRLFRRAFLSTNRPQPREWVEQLDALAKALKKCDMHSGHHYYRELSDCPWCGIETHTRVRLFNVELPGDDSRRGHFRLDEIWKQIESVESPDAPLIRWEKILKAPEPSAEIAALAATRDGRFTLALVFSIIAGILVSCIPIFSFHIIALIFAGIIARSIARVEHPSLEKIQDRLIRAEEAAQRLQDQYDREAGNERWDAKRDELRNRKKSYRNLAQLRRFKLQELEAETRKSRLHEFLDQFKIADAEIRGVVAPIKAALLSHGVETAADVVEDVEELPSVGRSQAQRLIEWRRSLEQKFVFDPIKGVPREVRSKTEREVDTLRLHLESELIGGPDCLRRVKQEIETSRQKLQPVLKLARQELAKAEKDLEIASYRDSSTLILIVLIISFFIGWVIRL